VHKTRQRSLAPDLLSTRLEHVVWIGGPPGAGKSTIASQLSVEHGLSLYICDGTMSDHVGRSNSSDHPLLHDFLAMDMDERWVNRPPSVMFKTFQWFQGEGFELILEDLLSLPKEPPILAEGFRLLPQQVSPLLTRSHQAVWLVPTPEFRRAAFDSRGVTWGIPGKTSDPTRALANLLARDQLFTDEVVKQATGLNLTVIEVDHTTSIDQVLMRVAKSLGLGTR
jgi:2-phosphoglycerate kinase